jgi:hypothetical protein
MGYYLVLVVLALFLPSSSVMADEPPLACDPRESPEVCALKVQRNNALDELALAMGKTRRAEVKAAATGASPITIAATNLLTTIVSMGTPAAATINLPTAVQTAGFRSCVKDGTTNFSTNNATVKSPTSGTIDGVAGATGVVMNQVRQELCFISDGTNWFIE